MNHQICTMCHREIPTDEIIEFDDQLICHDCYENHTAICAHCGERIWIYDDAGDSYTHLCRSCYEHHYVACERCGRIIRQSDAYYPEEDDYPYCQDCNDEYLSKKMIHDYNYKPEPIFYGDGERYFGVELEVDGAGEDADKAEAVLSAAHRNGLEYIYCKHDGSLEDGFEIVTHPMTLEFHQTEMPWQVICSEAIEQGYRSHQCSTCGLHIHVNRSAFGESEYLQDQAIARVLYFFEKHWEELLKFSRRTQRQLERWAARYGYQEQPRDILNHAKKSYGNGRYTCVNLTNTDTIEFRIFRGTLKMNTIIATLQLVNRICDLAIFMSDEEVKNLAWSDFVYGVTESELIQYLKERMLYVNDDVEGEVEI